MANSPNNKGRNIAFEQIAVIPYDEKVYCILKPIDEIENVGEDEAVVFYVDESGAEPTLLVETDEKKALTVFNKYYDLLEEDNEKVATSPVKEVSRESLEKRKMDFAKNFATESDGENVDEEDFELEFYKKELWLCIQKNRAQTAIIQRELSVGFSRASRAMAWMDAHKYTDSASLWC